MRRTDPALLLLPQERRIGYGLAVASALAFLVLWTPWAGRSQSALFGIGVLFAASLALVTRRGHRLWTAFASFLLGVFGPWGFGYVLGALHVAFAFWLGWRAHRAVKASVALAAAAPEVAPERKARPVESGRVTPKGTARRRPTRRS